MDLYRCRDHYAGLSQDHGFPPSVLHIQNCRLPPYEENDILVASPSASPNVSGSSFAYSYGEDVSPESASPEDGGAAGFEPVILP
jgi:hypothetical protein